MDRNFLIVASDGKVREELAGDLRDRGFSIILAENGAEAERVLRSVTVRTALIESHLPDTTGEQLRARLHDARPECRVIVLTSFKLVRSSPELLRFGPDDYLLRSSQIQELLRAPYETEGDFGVLPWEEPGHQALLETIDVLVSLLELEYRNFASSSHQAMLLARATAEEIGASDEMIHEVVVGTLLRDVGKVGLDLEMSTVGKQSEAWNHRVAEHVSASLRLFEHIEFPWKIMPVVRHHHERYDGSGAPHGLRGREIPMAARIVAVVDAYVATTCGKGDEAKNPDEALRELVGGAGHQFDPEVVEAFHRVIDKRLSGRKSKGAPVVMIFEPDSDFARALSMRLGNEGLEVAEADSYSKCLKRLLEDPPDLALLEVDTDPHEAFELLHEMQQDENLCNIPIAFLSQRSDRILRIRALRQGVDDFLSKGDDMDEVVARVESILVRKAVRADDPSRRARRGITGSLENLGLPDIVQTLVIGMKTACISLSCAGREGQIWFENGAPRHAEVEDLKGEKAFYEMVRWTDGEFVIEHGVKTGRSSVNHDAMFLLMEGLRLMDEDGGTEEAPAAS